jgi:HEAT repeat protein
MRAAVLMAALAAPIGLWAAAGAGGQLQAPAGDPQVVEQLSGIDYVPTRGSLDEALGEAGLEALIAIARGEGDEDAGLRIRAYRALSLYPGSQTAAALHDAVAEHISVAGVDTLYLQAAMSSLARIDGEGAVPSLGPMLDHPSRDVRAAAATALGETGSGDAIPLLRARLPLEAVIQVRLAIADALRALE